MKPKVTKAAVRKLVGKQIYAVKKDGAKVSGILRRIKGNQLIVELPNKNKAKTKAFIPLVLFDLLAIGTSPFGFGGFGFGGGFDRGFGFGEFGGGFGGFDGFF
jgi:hypothetical protein